jgi:hypothetical protein
MKKKELLKRIEALEKQFDILSDEVMDLEVEKQMQPCPTAAKFKAIADHANSINDVIQNAPKDKKHKCIYCGKMTKMPDEKCHMAPETANDETIYVPDGILDVNMEIINGNMALFYNDEVWSVLPYYNTNQSTHQQFKLEPCKREDLKVGDVAFRTSFDKPTFDNLSRYCIVLEDGCQYWNQRECQFDDMSYNHLYKIVEA